MIENSIAFALKYRRQVIYGKIKADSADMEEQNDFLFEFDTLSDSDRENSTDSSAKLKIEDDLDIEFIDVVELETTLHEE